MSEYHYVGSPIEISECLKTGLLTPNYIEFDEEGKEKTRFIRFFAAGHKPDPNTVKECFGLLQYAVIVLHADSAGVPKYSPSMKFVDIVEPDVIPFNSVFNVTTSIDLNPRTFAIMDAVDSEDHPVKIIQNLKKAKNQTLEKRLLAVHQAETEREEAKQRQLQSESDERDRIYEEKKAKEQARRRHINGTFI